MSKTKSKTNPIIENTSIWMPKTMKLIRLFSLVIAAALFASCEPMDAVDPFGLIHDDDESSSSEDGSQSSSSSGGGSQSSSSSGGGSQSSSSSSSGSQPSSSASVSGVWSGRSATTQVSTTLRLSENGGSISGSLTWPGGDKRSVSGSRSGSSVTLHIGGGDTWKMKLSGDKMSGTGYKAGGGTYALSFKRK